MIRSVADPDTERVWHGITSRRLPPDLQQTARRKLRQLNGVKQPLELREPRGNRLDELKGERKGTYTLRISDQWRITFRWSDGGAIAEGDRLENVHPGDILREDFRIGTDLSLAEVARGTGIPVDTLAAVLASRREVDASVDARLTRYLRMSEGFFLRLQNDYDLEAVHRTEGDALDRIVPRAA